MIHLITGMQGSGKTLFLVKKAYEFYLKGKKIYSNVALNFPYKPIDYNDIINCKYNNAVVIIDEAHRLLPSRRSLSSVNIEICDGFISQVRKQNLELFLSTQTQRKIDIRIREEADYIYLCEKWVFINKIWKQQAESSDLDKKIPVIISVTVCQTFSSEFLQFNFNGNDYYNLFDTKQIIQVKGIKL